LFYSLLLSWVYENGFANFYQGLSPEKNLKIKLVGSASFPVPVTDGVPHIASQIQ
jgi:hypothetical protein